MAMEFADFFGLDDLIERLKRSVNAPDGFAQATLFAGPHGTGKRSLAEICLRALNCTGQNKPCGLCPACRKHLDGVFRDHVVVEPEKGLIRVDRMRDLIDRISTKPFEGGRITVLIPNAEAMNPQAQNALLKTIEDPPPRAFLLFTADHTAGLLPTIRSRVRLIRTHPVSDQDVEMALRARGIEEGRVRELAAISQGCVGAALRYAQDENDWALHRRVLAALDALQGPPSVPQASQCLLGDREQASQVLDMFEEIAAARMRREIAFGTNQADAPASELLKGVYRARRQLASHVAWQSVLEDMFLELAGGTR